MPALLVDYENVNGSNGLKGVDALCEKDTLIIFYSNCCTRIRYDHMQDIIESGCKFRVIKLKGAGKNALDFYIATECGIASEKGEKQLAIISNDKGYQAVMDFFEVSKRTQEIQIIRAGNVETALTMLETAENAGRKEKLLNRMEMVELELEYAEWKRNVRRQERKTTKKTILILLGKNILHSIKHKRRT